MYHEKKTNAGITDRIAAYKMIIKFSRILIEILHIDHQKWQLWYTIRDQVNYFHF